MNDAIATVGSNALVLDNPAEENMGREASMIEKQAQAVRIANDADYAAAGDLTSAIKRMQKQVKDYWEPLRVSAKKAYDHVLGRKKEMLSPLENAEMIMKLKMSGYVERKEEERKKQEDAMRRLAEQEMERKLAEAAEAEAVGDSVSAEFAMAEAEVMESVVTSVNVAPKAPKVSGVSHSKAWQITEIDLGAVPVTFNGALIRPVDEKAVMALIKASKGQIQIPGVTYKEITKISVRS